MGLFVVCFCFEFYVCLYVCVWFGHLSALPAGLEEATEAPGVIGSCVLPDLGARDQNSSPLEEHYTLNHQEISTAPPPFFKLSN